MVALTKDKALEQLHMMLLCRRFEEACLKGYQQKKITGFCHTYIGQEAVATGCLMDLEPQDAVVTSYRCHAHGLALGMDVGSVMAEMFGKITGCARGKGGSMHVFSKEKNFLGGHGIVGGQIPIGVGAGFYFKFKKIDGVSLVFFGDGGSVQGTFHESMNLASLWDLPVIFICENNGYAMGTALNRAVCHEAIEDRAVGYGMKGYRVDGRDLNEVYPQMQEIIAEVRKTKRPALVNMVTYRLKGHSVSDAGLYRSKEEVEAEMAKGCILKFKKDLMAAGYIDEEAYKAMDKAVKAEIREAVQFADESPWPPMDELTNQVL